jgi:hypothetical protein
MTLCLRPCVPVLALLWGRIAHIIQALDNRFCVAKTIIPISSSFEQIADTDGPVSGSARVGGWDSAAALYSSPPFSCLLHDLKIRRFVLRAGY